MIVETEITRVEKILEDTINKPSLETAMSISEYIKHAKRQIDQIRRRVIEGESIPHNEKVFSIFEEHTEWISKGKAGVPQELGLLVNVMKDQFGFILHHQVAWKQKDVHLAVPMVEETQKRFPNLTSCSFDKGYSSAANKEKLESLLDTVIMPKKGKLSKADKEIEYSEAFKAEKRKHSAVEASISVLENHGLDRCPDHGKDGFKRYVGLAVLGRNIQHLGHHIQKKRIKKENRVRLKKAA
jgi:hypothetical protein